MDSVKEHFGPIFWYVKTRTTTTAHSERNGKDRADRLGGEISLEGPAPLALGID
jgi:hypothetical protein